MYLYHATYRENAKRIKSEGLLLSSNGRTWNNCKKLTSCIYLTSDMDLGASYCETSEDVPEKWLDEIVMLAVESSTLDLKYLVKGDQNCLDAFETYMYFKNISPDKIGILANQGNNYTINKLSNIKKFTKKYIYS